MLVLSRKRTQAICVGDQVIVTVCAIEGNNVRLGITAPDDVKILRKELVEANGKEATSNCDRSQPAA